VPTFPRLVTLAASSPPNDSSRQAPGGLSEDGEFFVVNSTREYQKGEQVFVSYGAKSNGELLKNYGFVLEENPVDFVSLHFELKVCDGCELCSTRSRDAVLTQAPFPFVLHR